MLRVISKIKTLFSLKKDRSNLETSITECKAREKILSDAVTRRPGASMKKIQEYYDQTIVKLGRDTRELEKTLGTIKEMI